MYPAPPMTRTTTFSFLTQTFPVPCAAGIDRPRDFQPPTSLPGQIPEPGGEKLIVHRNSRRRFSNRAPITKDVTSSTVCRNVHSLASFRSSSPKTSADRALQAPVTTLNCRGWSHRDLLVRIPCPEAFRRQGLSVCHFVVSSARALKSVSWRR